MVEDAERRDLFGEQAEGYGTFRSTRRIRIVESKFELYTGLPGQNAVLMESLWGTREALLQHLRSDRYKSFLQLVETSLEEPLVEFFFVSRTLGLEIVEEVRGRWPDLVSQGTTALPWSG